LKEGGPTLVALQSVQFMPMFEGQTLHFQVVSLFGTFVGISWQQFDGTLWKREDLHDALKQVPLDQDEKISVMIGFLHQQQGYCSTCNSKYLL
jgi:hypothetical protein